MARKSDPCDDWLNELDEVDIIVGTPEEYFEKTPEDFKEVEAGRKEFVHTVFMPLKDLQNLLSGKKLEILDLLSKHEIHSVYQLAKLLGRDTKNVYTDIHSLRRYDLIKDVKTGAKTLIKPKYKEMRFRFKIPS